jgi:excisionase family DNA binding protein
MLLLDHIVPARWYTINETAEILGWERDTIIRLIESGYLQAQVKPKTGSKRCREFLCRLVQGCEIIRFVKDNLSIPEPRLMRRRMRMI